MQPLIPFFSPCWRTQHAFFFLLSSPVGRAPVVSLHAADNGDSGGKLCFLSRVCESAFFPWDNYLVHALAASSLRLKYRRMALLGEQPRVLVGSLPFGGWNTTTWRALLFFDFPATRRPLGLFFFFGVISSSRGRSARDGILLPPSPTS